GDNARRRHDLCRRAANAAAKVCRQRRDPPRKSKAVAPRAGGRWRQRHCFQPAGGRDHRRQLSRRHHHLQGQARLRRDRALLDGQHHAHPRFLHRQPARGGLVHARRLPGAGTMSARQIFAKPARYAAITPYLWMVLFFLVPFGFVLKIALSQTAIAQPPYTPVFDFTEGVSAIKAAFGELSLDNFRLLISDNLYILSYFRSLVVAVTSTAILLLIGYPIAYGMARLPQRWQGIAMMLVIVPFWASFLVRIYACVNFFYH